MSCGVNLPGRTRLPGIKALPWVNVGDPDFLWVNVFKDRSVAEESRRLNEDNHGHRGHVHGPFESPYPDTPGWIVIVDLRACLHSSRPSRGGGPP